MLKRLLFTSLCPLFFMPVFAQTHKDSVKSNPVTDTAAKHAATDTTTKKQVIKPETSADSGLESYQPAVKATKVSSAKMAAKSTVVSDSEPKHSTVKTVSDLRYNAYLKGDDLDEMALAGDLNHFPSPDSVLKYKKQLDLSPIQVGQLTKLSTELHRKKVEMGGNIIRNEKMLDNLFHSRQIDEGSLIFYTNRSGLYYGEMKGAILMACYNTEKLLTPPQIKKLETLEQTN